MVQWTDCLSSTSQIDKAKSIVCLLEESLPDPDDKISDMLFQIQENLEKAADAKGIPKPSTGSFSNCRGDWFEVLIAAGFWQARATNKEKYRDIVFALLPNRNSLDMFRLFTPEEEYLLTDLRTKLQGAGIGMITSNPDMIGCLVDDQEIRTLMENPLTCLTESNHRLLLDFYSHLIGKCSRKNLLFGVALKTSTRGDRQLQIPNEGSLWKAIISHLHTRYWEASPKFKYHAIILDNLSQAEQNAFNTVATHSITDPNVKPVPATDKAYAVVTFGDIFKVAQDIFDRAIC